MIPKWDIIFWNQTFIFIGHYSMFEYTLFLLWIFKIFDQVWFSVYRLLAHFDSTSVVTSGTLWFDKVQVTLIILAHLFKSGGLSEVLFSMQPLVLSSRSSQRRLGCSILQKGTERHFGQKQFWDPPGSGIFLYKSITILDSIHAFNLSHNFVVCTHVLN